MSNNRDSRNVGAFILIGIGVIMLFSQLGIGFDFNWWAIFIALPGLAMLRNAYNAQQEKGRLDSNELIQGGLGIFLLLMALGFLFDIELDFLWNLWPLALIAVGIAMILGSNRNR